MNYASGQMASIVRLVSTDPYQPYDRVVRTVPLLRRAAWQPWPWRLWGGPSQAYGRSIEDYPYLQPYAVGQAAPADAHEAASALVTAIRSAARYSQPPAWAPTVAFQRAFDHAFGPFGGLGTYERPELLKIDGIYGPRTELALSRVLGGIPQLMASYGPPSSSATAGSPGQSDILSGTSIDPRLAAAVEQLSQLLMGLPGVQAIADNARSGIDVLVLPAYAAAARDYIVHVLRGVFMGYPVEVHASSPVIA